MSNPLIEAQFFASFDGARLAYRTVGEGRPVVLLHGLFSNAETNWLRWGTAQTVADAGFRVIMPDLRAHGLSAAPHEAAAYPPDVLAQDAEALIAHLALTDFDLGGYSLGARTTVRLLARGMRPRRVVLGGMGLSGTVGGSRRRDFFLNAVRNRDSVARGSEEWMAVQFMKTMKIDPDAVIHLLPTFGDMPEAQLRAIDRPVLVVCGEDDHDNGSAPDLAALLPHATLREIPGNHMSAVSKPELGQAIAAFLAAKDS